MDFIVNFDWAVFKFFEKLWNPVLYVIMSVITYLGDDGIFWIILGVCLLIPKKTRRFGVYVLGGLAVAGRKDQNRLISTARGLESWSFFAEIKKHPRQLAILFLTADATAGTKSQCTGER